MRWAVILAGGAGSRFWPLSTPVAPKQLLPLTGERSTAEQTMQRLEGLIPRERVLVVTGPALGPALARALGLGPGNLLVEPRAASTGPALVWATWEARRRDPEAQVLSLHADWAIRDDEAFRRTADEALTAAARHRRLVTVGIVPTRPDTGYGYIVPGTPLDHSARGVVRFTEKPDAATALDLMASGALWNSGLFAWTADTLLAEVRRHTPEIAPTCRCSKRAGWPSSFRPSPPSRLTWGCWNGAPRWRWSRAISPGTTSAPGTPCPGSGPATRGATSPWGRSIWWTRRTVSSGRTAIPWC